MSRTLDNLARDEDAYEEMVEDKQVGMPMFIDCLIETEYFYIQSFVIQFFVVK